MHHIDIVIRSIILPCDPQDIDDLIYGDAVTVPSERLVF